MGIWESLLNNVDFQKQIQEKGYSNEIRFIDYIKENELEKIMQRTGAVTAQMLSIDFYSKQAPELVKNNLFLLRTGQGKFMIFNQNFFDKAYLELNNKNAKEINLRIPKDYAHLVKAYLENSNENPSIELLHFLGIFKKIIQEITGEEEYFIGPRGNKTSKFEVYLFNKKLKENQKVYAYYGQEELDYSIFTKNAIFIFEAKNQEQNGFDIGWHKIAYPVNRFRDLNKPIHPCYFLRQKDQIYLYIFPEFTFYEKGIVVNDKKLFTPVKTFKINLVELNNKKIC